MAYLFALLIAFAQIAAFVAVIVIGIALAARSRRAAVLWLLSVVTSRRLPLTTELEAFGEGFLQGDRRRVGQISSRLQAGSTLAEALSGTPGFVTDDAVLLAHVGERAGRLGEAFAAEADRLARARDAAIAPTTSPSLMLMYLVAVPLIIPVIVSGLMIFIIPKFKKIFNDFGSSFPWMTEQLIDSSDLFAKYWYLGVLCMLAVAMLAVSLLALSRVYTWDLRLPRRLIPGGRGRRASLALRALAIAAKGEGPLENALDPMANAAPNPSDRRAFDKIRQRFRSGEGLWSALAAERLISRRDAQLLDAAEVVGNLPWALALLAERIDDRNRRLFAIMIEVVQPAVVVLLGALVSFICVGIFLPLVQLLNDLS